jgi:quercetin 2,3-dioxygenase
MATQVTRAVHTMSALRKISQSKLGVSEPNPYHFGNEPNEKNHDSWTNGNWLKSRFHFSFAEYYNPSNTNFGVLRVMNDDLVQPMRGFGTHGHRDAEICTYVIDGHLTHKDSMGTSETLSRGAIQFMTAGSGVQHSEHNNSPDTPLRFIQMWLTPRRRGLTPNYGSSQGSADKRRNQFHHMVSDVDNVDVQTDVKINTDANMYATEMEPSQSLSFEVRENRQAYVLCVEGQTNVLNENATEEESRAIVLDRHDSSEIVGPMKVTFQTNDDTSTHLLVVEMAYDHSNSGRTDL